MTTSEIAQTATGLIGRCKHINEQLERALALTIEITGQHYDESKTAGLDESDTMSNLLSWLQTIALKVNNLVTQLDHIKEQF